MTKFNLSTTSSVWLGLLFTSNGWRVGFILRRDGVLELGYQVSPLEVS